MNTYEIELRISLNKSRCEILDLQIKTREEEKKQLLLDTKHLEAELL